MKHFIVAGLAERDGQWYAFGTYDNRFLSLTISAEEADEIRPKLDGDRTYSMPVEDERMARDAEVLIATGSPEGVRA